MGVIKNLELSHLKTPILFLNLRISHYLTETDLYLTILILKLMKGKYLACWVQMVLVNLPFLILSPD